MNVLGTAVLCLLGCSVGASATHPPQNVSRMKVRVPATDPALHDLLVAAAAAAEKHHYATAAADYENYLAKQPGDATAHFNLGFVYTALQQRDKAIAQYRQAIRLEPKMGPAYLNLGVSLSARDPKSAIEPLTQAVALLPANSSAHFALGYAEERTGNLPAAIGQYTAAETLDPNYIPTHLALARALYAAGNFEGAAAESRKALLLQPRLDEAAYALAQSLLKLNQRPEAAAALADYLTIVPGDVRVRVERASLLADLGRNEEALAELDRAAKAGSETIDALELRAVIDTREKKFAPAAAALEKAETMAPQDAEVHARLGHLLLEQKNYPAAARKLGQALELGPASTDTLRDLVAAEYLGKNYPAALEALDLLTRREPLPAGAWFVRATCYDRLGRGAEALAAYQRFLAVNTDKTSNEYFEAAARARYLEAALKEKKR